MFFERGDETREPRRTQADYKRNTIQILTQAQDQTIENYVFCKYFNFSIYNKCPIKCYLGLICAASANNLHSSK